MVVQSPFKPIGWFNPSMRDWVKTDNQEQSTYFKGLTKEQEDYIFNYVDNNATNQLQKNQMANEMYKTALESNQKKLMQKEREAANVELTNKMVTSEDKNTKNFISSQIMFANLADIIRTDADNQWYDLSKKNDKTVVTEFMSNNPKYAQLVSNIIKWNNSITELWDELWVYKSSNIQEANATWWLRRWLVNDMNETTVTDAIVNPVWKVFEMLDDAVQKIPVFEWEWARNSLLEKLDNLSDEQIKEYRDKYVKAYWSYDSDENFMRYVIRKEASLWEDLVWADTDILWEKQPSPIKMAVNMIPSALKTATATARWLSNPFDTMRGLIKLVSSEEWRNAIIQRYGSLDAFADSMNSDPVWVSTDALTALQWGAWIAWKGSSFLSKISKLWGLENTAGKFSNAANTLKNLSQTAWWSADLWVWVAKENLSNIISKGTQSENALIRNASKAVDWSLKNQTDFMKTNLDRVNTARWDIADSLVWLDKSTKEMIKQNPEITNYVNRVKTQIEESNWVYDWGKAYTNSFYNELGNEITKKLESYQEWMKNDNELYKQYKEAGETLSTKGAIEWVDKVLEKNGIKKVKLWKKQDKEWFDFKDSWMTEWSSKIQDIYEYMQRHETLNWDEVLTLNEKFRNAMNWMNKWSTEYRILSEMRKSVKDDLHSQSEAYKELDALYEKDIKLLQELSDWLTKRNWEIKDNLKTTLKKIKSDPELANRLEDVYPWITKKVEALDSMPKLLDNVFSNETSYGNIIWKIAVFWAFNWNNVVEIARNLMLWAGLKYAYNKTMNARWEKALTSLSEEGKAYLAELENKATKWEVFTDKERADVKKVKELIEKAKKDNIKEEIKQREQKSLFWELWE